MSLTSFKTITEIHEAFDKKILSPIELTRDYLRAIKASQLNAYLTTCEDKALAQAKFADQILAHEGKVPRQKFPLLGIPIGIKDIFTTEGVRTTCGSKMLENYIPPYTATCVKRLEEAGTIVLGKLNMDEFAMGSSNENSAFGPVSHPTHPGYVPGGSSGGSAAAVRAGLCVGALGTDTGGSIRLPASFCGIVGIKPTYGRVSRYGLVAFASSLDQAGPMARSVLDAAQLLNVMSGHDPMDSTSSPLPKEDFLAAIKAEPDWKKIRIGIPREYKMGGLSQAVEESIRKSIQWMIKQGAKTVEISLPHTSYAVAVYYVVAVSEASSNLARFDGVRFGVRTGRANESEDLDSFYKQVRSGFGDEVKRRIILGTFALSSGYYDAYYRKACQVRRLIKNDFDRVFQEVDLIVSPVSPTTAFKSGAHAQDPLKMYLNDLFTIPANLAGLPALSLPCGVDEEGLPIGLQMTGPAHSDARLLTLAHSFEKVFTGVSQ